MHLYFPKLYTVQNFSQTGRKEYLFSYCPGSHNDQCYCELILNSFMKPISLSDLLWNALQKIVPRDHWVSPMMNWVLVLYCPYFRIHRSRQVNEYHRIKYSSKRNQLLIPFHIESNIIQKVVGNRNPLSYSIVSSHSFRVQRWWYFIFRMLGIRFNTVFCV